MGARDHGGGARAVRERGRRARARRGSGGEQAGLSPLRSAEARGVPACRYRLLRGSPPRERVAGGGGGGGEGALRVARGARGAAAAPASAAPRPGAHHRVLRPGQRRRRISSAQRRAARHARKAAALRSVHTERMPRAPQTIRHLPGGQTRGGSGQQQRGGPPLGVAASRQRLRRGDGVPPRRGHRRGRVVRRRLHGPRRFVGRLGCTAPPPSHLAPRP
mmetsp:Transcript_5402/g.18684  ORF Transcript_5402/g.18684 Transcript_5402/m.18684 type:complete len:219 (+) Transcript_5402:283-939(+)